MSERTCLLVVGASSDLGREIIRATDDGSCLVLAHHHGGAAKLEELRAALGPRLIPIRADLAADGGAEALIAEVKKHCAFPDKIVHLAAPKLAYVRFKDLTWERMKTELDVEFRSLFLVLREFLPAMAKAKKGKVVVMLSSVCVSVPPKALAHYAAAKHALLGLTRALASEYASSGVTVNAVSPSMVETAFLAEVPEKLVELAAASHPRGRNATPADVAPLVRFLLSPESDYLTGANIPVAGGAAF